MNIREYHDFVMKLKDEGYTHQKIKEALENEYGYKISRQAISRYISKQGIYKLEIKDQILENDLEVVYSSRSTRKAHQYLIENGYDISYHKVSLLRNQKKHNNIKYP